MFYLGLILKRLISYIRVKQLKIKSKLANINLVEI